MQVEELFLVPHILALGVTETPSKRPIHTLRTLRYIGDDMSSELGYNSTK